MSMNGNMRDRLTEALKNSTADYAEVRVESSRSTRVVFRGKRLELPWLSGAVVRLGAEAGVPTPTHAQIETLLRPFVDGGTPPMA